MLTTRLDPDARPKLLKHLLALPAADRRMRFGASMLDAAVEGYVARLDFDRDVVYGVYEGNLDLAGVTHLSISDGVAEFGVSVLPACRRQGIGTALISRAALHARNQGLPLLFMQCLSENHAIIRIARGLGMRVVSYGPECEASLPLRKGTPATLVRELLEDGIALCDYSLRAHFLPADKGRATGPRAARDEGRVTEDARAA
jgi:RimJ/RimL family protein N-acetyltransferase